MNWCGSRAARSGKPKRSCGTHVGGSQRSVIVRRAVNARMSKTSPRSTATVWAMSGVHRSLRPFPQVRTWAPVPSSTSFQLSEVGMSHLADNVVVLQYLRAESEVKRALLVLKTRASDHHPAIREFKIRPEGIVLGDQFDADQEFG